MSRQKEKLLKILLVQTSNGNLGDSVIGDNDEFLLRKALGKKNYEILRYNLNSEDIGQIRYVDAVIFAGGILRTHPELFYRRIPEVIEEANRLNIPVFLCAIGVEPVDLEDPKAKRLITAVNLPCVREISIRDDIGTFSQQFQKNSLINVSEVYDPAVWCAISYQSVLQTPGNVIGLGITREALFADYGHPEITREIQLQFWKETAEELEDRNLPWVLFTNGLPEDEDFALEVLSFIGHGEKLPAPETSTDLVRMISGFRAVIAGRMHSQIIAYALKIPGIGFLWNQKLLFWARKTGQEQRFLPVDQLKGETAVRALLQALSEKKKGASGKQRKLVLKPMKRFVKQWVKPGYHGSETLDVQKALTAVSLGCVQERYLYTNSPEALQNSSQQGFRNFHADLRYTEDQVLVCVNRWHKETFRMFSLPFDPEKPYQQSLSSEQFLQCRSYHRFSTMTFDRLSQLLETKYQNRYDRVVISIGRPGKEILPDMAKEIEDTLKKHQLPLSRFLLRVERQSDVTLLREHSCALPLQFFQTDPQKEPEETKKICKKNLEFCVSNQIEYFLLSSYLLKPEILELVRKYPVKLCAMAPSGVQEMTDLLKNGAEMVDSKYYSVSYWQRLFRN